jgi:hypothetical protein
MLRRIKLAGDLVNYGFTYPNTLVRKANTYKLYGAKGVLHA